LTQRRIRYGGSCCSPPAIRNSVRPAAVGLLWCLLSAAAVAAGDPALVWSLEPEELGGEARVLAPATLAGAVVVGLTGGEVVGLEPGTGIPGWRFHSPLEPAWIYPAGGRLLVVGRRGSGLADVARPGIYAALYEPPLGVELWSEAVGSDPVVDLALGPAHVALVHASGGVRVLDLAAGELLWELLKAGDQVGSPLLTADALYLAVGRQMEKREPITGALEWRAPLGEVVHARPALLRDRLLVGTEDARVYALKTDTGKVDWSLDVGGPVMADLLSLGGSVLAVTWANQLLCLKRNGHSRWRVAIDGRISTPPVLWQDCVVLLPQRSRRVAVHDLLDGRRQNLLGLPQGGRWLVSTPVASAERLTVLTNDGVVIGLQRPPEREPMPEGKSLDQIPPREEKRQFDGSGFGGVGAMDGVALDGTAK
jgi:outer membrane protein assembly factor BamB